MPTNKGYTSHAPFGAQRGSILLVSKIASFQTKTAAEATRYV